MIEKILFTALVLSAASFLLALVNAMGRNNSHMPKWEGYAAGNGMLGMLISGLLIALYEIWK